MPGAPPVPKLLSVLFLDGMWLFHSLPVGSSIGDASGSTSLIKMARIFAGYLIASLEMKSVRRPWICVIRKNAYCAYNSKSCSPESPIRMNLEFSKASRILTRPSRLRSAGAVSRFLNKEPAAYDFNLMEPRLRGQNKSYASTIGKYLVVIELLPKS